MCEYEEALKVCGKNEIKSMNLLMFKKGFGVKILFSENLEDKYHGNYVWVSEKTFYGKIFHTFNSFFHF